MVLRKAAIALRVRSTPRTGAQIGDQFLQLDRTSFYFDPDVGSVGSRPYQQVKPVRRRAMLWPAPLQNNLTSQPATFQHKERGGGELANILAQKPGGPFRRENRNTETGPVLRSTSQVTLNLAFRVQGEQILFQPQEKILRFPGRQGRIDFQIGKGRSLAGCFTESEKFLLEQRFGVTERPWIQCGNIGMQQWFAKQIDSEAQGRYLLARKYGVAFTGPNNSKL